MVNNSETPEFKTLSQVTDANFSQTALNLHETASVEETVVHMCRDTMIFALAVHVNCIYGRTKMEVLVPNLNPRIKRAILLTISPSSKSQPPPP